MSTKFIVILCRGGLEGDETKEKPSEGLVGGDALAQVGWWFLSELYVSVLLYVWYFLIKFKVKKRERFRCR